jgi:hypothetical protein
MCSDFPISLVRNASRILQSQCVTAVAKTKAIAVNQSLRKNSNPDEVDCFQLTDLLSIVCSLLFFVGMQYFYCFLIAKYIPSCVVDFNAL